MKGNPKVKELKEKLDQEEKIWKTINERGVKATNDGSDEATVEKALEPTKEEKEQLKKLQDDIKDLDSQVAEILELETARQANAAKRALLNQPTHRPDMGTAGRDEVEVKTAGEMITDAPEFKEWLNRVAPAGKEINAKLKLESPVVKLKELGLGDLRELGYKDLVMSVPTTAGGGLVRRDYGPWPIDLPLRQPSIRDVITILQTGSNLIEYVRVNSLTRAAKIVPEATSETDDAALKPKAGMSIEIVQTGVKTIAVIMLATRTILADAPQLQSMMTQFMRTDIDLELEEEIISGPGGANHFTGLENTANLTPQAFDTDKLTTARKARTKALIVGRARSTGFLLNPYDWEALDLTKDAENRYYFGGPLSMGTKMLWGLPVIESEVIPQGTFYTGDLKQMVVWDRQDPTVYITDSNRDYFERNIITILYEGRWAFGVLRPPAIVKGDFHAGANS
jgi:HK97 family phage major capsid protein